VTLIERKSGIGDPPHPANTFFQGMFDKTNEVVHAEYVIREMTGAEIVSPSGSRIVVDAPGYIIDRKKFDEYHARELIGQNVDIRTGVTAHNIIKKNKKIQTSTSDRTFTSDIVIIADGISSQLSALAGLHPTKYPHDIAWAVEAEVEADGIGTRLFRVSCREHRSWLEGDILAVRRRSCKSRGVCAEARTGRLNIL